MSMNGTDEAFEVFGEIVRKRFERILNGEASIADVYRESEDTIRYMMFRALTRALDLRPEFVFLEYPHPHVPAKKNPKLDTFVEAHNGVPSMAFEMKFTVKNVENGHNLPKTQVLGALVSDLIRLHYVKDVDLRYFVWVFDRDMGSYICNRDAPWRSLVSGGNFSFSKDEIQKLCKVARDEIRKRIGENFKIGDIVVSTVYAKNFSVNGRTFGIRIHVVDPPDRGSREGITGGLCGDFRKKQAQKTGRKQRKAGSSIREHPCIRSKYTALAEWLKNRRRKSFTISLSRLEDEVRSIDPSFYLPPAAKKYLAWWGNHRGNVQAGCGWLSAGWKARPIFRNGVIESVEFTPI